ncbi:MAG TPA: ATP-binding protein [Coleofasciculaceae cyanobacterium]|jgi:signal transduction histidine kinase
MEQQVVSEAKPGANHIHLDGLFGHLCSSTGLYSKETFLSLYSCITRMVRDHRMSGFVMTRTLEDAAFETMAHALDSLPELPLFRFNQPDLFPTASGICDQTGFLIVLTNRMCATLFWSAATHESFRLYEGGWTFHPGDSRTIATQIISHLSDSEAGQPDLEHLLAETQVDRRYDDKLNVLITSLVHGLENRNRELTVALEQVKTLNKRNIDTERLAAIGQLSSVIAHEIRNPLGLIDLYAKLTEDQMAKLDLSAQGEKRDLLLKNLSLIRQATGSLETILSELTNYSRPLQLNVKTTDINQLVLDVCDFYAPKYDEKGVALNMPKISDEEALELDADKIRQALINLLKNALEASPAGAAVTVSIARRKNDPQLYIKVADEGSGVDPNHQKKLFTPYFSTKGNGTGLGLAHSRKILQAHGGSVELLSSTPGKGSIFALVLPRARQTLSPSDY